MMFMFERDCCGFKFTVGDVSVYIIYVTHYVSDFATAQYDIMFLHRMYVLYTVLDPCFVTTVAPNFASEIYLYAVLT